MNVFYRQVCEQLELEQYYMERLTVTYVFKMLRVQLDKDNADALVALAIMDLQNKDGEHCLLDKLVRSLDRHIV